MDNSVMKPTLCLGRARKYAYFSANNIMQRRPGFLSTAIYLARLMVLFGFSLVPQLFLPACAVTPFKNTESCRWIATNNGEPSTAVQAAEMATNLYITSSAIGPSIEPDHSFEIRLIANQNTAATPDDKRTQSNIKRSGYLIPMPRKLDIETINLIIREIEKLKLSEETQIRPAGTPRKTVVLYFTDNQTADLTDTPIQQENNELRPSINDPAVFEDQLRLARYLTSINQRSIRFVAWIDRPISKHSLLPILAAETIITSSRARLVGFDSETQTALDMAAKAAFIEIAKQRALFPPAVVSALLDPKVTLSMVNKTNGQRVVLATEALNEERESGNILQEQVLSRSGVTLDLTAEQIRSLNISSKIQEGKSDVSEFLDLATLTTLQLSTKQLAPPVGCLLEIRGSISKSRLRRWQSNLFATSKREDINTWLIDIDSDGGDLLESTRFANWLTSPAKSIQTVAANVSNRVTGDALLIAFACRPLFLASDSRLGGRGLATPETTSMNPEILDTIHNLAFLTQRSPGLIQGLVDPSVDIYRYTHRKTGAVIFSAESELNRQLLDPGQDEAEINQNTRANWIRGEKLDLNEGLTAKMAIELGLADGIAETPEIAVTQLELKEFPFTVMDQALIRAIERIGGNPALAILVLFIGFAALSAEFSSPGLGIPGFIALLCFSLYFWVKFLSGTAEWLELLALLLGILCVGIEFFVVPGFGIFGIGGFLLTGFSLILMSQTFVIPRNAYQLNALAEGVWAMLAGLAGLIVGIFAMRTMATKVPVLRALTMELPDLQAIENAEKIGDYDHLTGQIGITTTPLHPSGKATFGDELIQVVSDGDAIESGQQIVVIRVRANHVLVRKHLAADE